jgi:hypothetical protein
LPALGTKIADPANRDRLAERCADPAVHKSLAVELARITSDDERLRDVELTRVNSAKHYAANTLSLLQTVPGLGNSLRLGLLYESHAIARCPRGQAVVSAGCLGKGPQASAGTRVGPSGTKIGHAHLTGAFSDAAVWSLSDHPPAQQDFARVEKTHDNGSAWPVLAHQLAPAV